MKPSVNLLPKYERYSNLSYILFIIGVILFIILASVLTYYFVQERNELEANESEINQLTEHKAILETRLEETTETDIASFADVVAFAESHAIPTTILVDELNSSLPDKSYLVDYLYDYHTVTIEAHFETMTDTANYMESLTNSDVVDEAQIDHIETLDPEILALEEEENLTNIYNIVSRYLTTYSMDVNQEELMKEEKDE